MGRGADQAPPSDEDLLSGENIFWTRDERADLLASTPDGVATLGRLLLAAPEPGGDGGESWFAGRLEALDLLERVALGGAGASSGPNIGDLLQRVVVERRATEGAVDVQRLDLGLRREALSSLTRIDPRRAVDLFVRGADRRLRSFFSHSLLVGLVDNGWAASEAAAYVDELSGVGPL